jgi:hypothetical protein
MAKPLGPKDPNLEISVTQEYRGPELFFGLVGAVGTDLRGISALLSRELQTVGYLPHEIRLSALLKECAKYKHLEAVDTGPEHLRITAHMDAGDDFRRTATRGDALALLAIGSVLETREELTGQETSKPVPGQAYIFNSLKHPSEIETLRHVYRSSFFVISIYESRELRLGTLCERIAKTSGKYERSQFTRDAEELIERDQKDIADDFEQNVRDSFAKADLFLNANNPVNLEAQVRRFVRMLFGFQFASPTVDEYCMFHARATALRSLDLSRQVGAVIATDTGEILAQ